MSTEQYLSYDGLLALWAKIKAADLANAASISELQEQIKNIPSDYSKVNNLKINDSGVLALYADDVQIGNGISVSEFVKDGMIDDISFVEASIDNPINESVSGKFIKFSWNTAAGKNAVYLSVSELGHVDLTQINEEINNFKSRLDTLEAAVSAYESNSELVNNKLQSLTDSLANVESEIESLKNAAIVYEEIKKNDETGDYESTTSNAPTASSVVNALNDLKSEFSKIDFDKYYNKEDIDDMMSKKLDSDNEIQISSIEELEGLGSTTH